MDYGTNKLTHIIEQPDGGKSLTVTQTWPDVVTSTFVVDGQPHAKPDGGSVSKYVAAWRGATLTISPGAGAKSDAFVNTRYKEGEQLVTVFSFPDKPGTPQITRYFTKVDQEAKKTKTGSASSPSPLLVAAAVGALGALAVGVMQLRA